MQNKSLEKLKKTLTDAELDYDLAKVLLDDAREQLKKAEKKQTQTAAKRTKAKQKK